MIRLVILTDWCVCWELMENTITLLFFFFFTRGAGGSLGRRNGELSLYGGFRLEMNTVAQFHHKRQPVAQNRFVKKPLLSVTALRGLCVRPALQIQNRI